MDMPKIGLGTFLITGPKCTEIVREGLKLGYTHIDTAQVYENEKQVGEGIQQSGVDRDKFFLTTKVFTNNFEYENVIKSVEQSLKDLQTDYIDLLLMHWPDDQQDHRKTLDAMMELKSQGKIKHIGVSNFQTKHILEAVEHTGGEIYNNQIEMHALLVPTNVINECKKHNIIISAYSPLGHGKILQDETLNHIAQKHNKSSAQIALKRLLQVHDVVILPKTEKVERLSSNIDLFDFELDEQDISEINALPKDQRFINPGFAPERDD